MGAITSKVIIAVSRLEEEYRTVSFAEDSAGHLHLCESSMGPTTEVIFGSPTRCHEIVVGNAHLAPLGWLLGASRACGTAADLLPHLASFFETGSAFLSDLMDELDAARIPYAYASWTEGEEAYFRPTGPAVSAGNSLQ